MDSTVAADANQLSGYPTDRKSCGYSIRYVKWLMQSGFVNEIGPDAFAVLVAVVMTEDDIHYQRPPTFYNDQLLSKCGIGSEPAMMRARCRAVEAGLLNYLPGAKRRPGVYFVSGFTKESFANPERIRNESVTNRLPTIPLPLPIPNNKRPKRAIGQTLFSKDDSTTAQWMFGLIKEMNPGNKVPNFDKWADEIRLLRERDNRSDSEIRSLFQAANSDSFWKKNILSPQTLRKQWDKLTIALGKSSQPAINAQPSTQTIKITEPIKVPPPEPLKQRQYPTSKV